MKARADLVIAQKALTNSKRPQTFIEGVYPTHASHARGALLYANSKPYVDYYGSLGANLLGYGNPFIETAVMQRFRNGATMSLSSEIEVDVAEKLKGIFPFTDLWKFGKSGSDVCSGSVRIARTFTGRDLVLSENYHGWHDDFVSLTPPALGIPKRDWIQKLDFDLIPKAACVIIEPVDLDFSKTRKEFLEKLRAECTKHGTVLIFDEIITGFRVPKFSVSNYFGIYPDIILLGKAMGGGLPLSAMGGRRDIMNGDYFYSGTFFGETCSLAACKALIDLLQKPSTKFDLNALWVQGEKFLSRFNQLHPYLQIRGYPTRGAWVGDDAVKALFWQEACLAGVLFGPSWFFNFALAEYTDQLMPVFKDILMRISNGDVKLFGNMPQSTFAAQVRGK